MVSRRTDQEYWAAAAPLLPDFMDDTYQKCVGWKCGVAARFVLIRFRAWLNTRDPETFPQDGELSYRTLYQELRRLGYVLPTVKGNFEAKTRIVGISLKEKN